MSNNLWNKVLYLTNNKNHEKCDLRLHSHILSTSRGFNSSLKAIKYLNELLSRLCDFWFSLSKSKLCKRRQRVWWLNVGNSLRF